MSDLDWLYVNGHVNFPNSSKLVATLNIICSYKIAQTKYPIHNIPQEKYFKIWSSSFWNIVYKEKQVFRECLILQSLHQYGQKLRH